MRRIWTTQLRDQRHLGLVGGAGPDIARRVDGLGDDGKGVVTRRDALGDAGVDGSVGLHRDHLAAEGAPEDDHRHEAGKEGDFIVLDLEATPLMARRMANAADLVERLFVLMMLGDDRAVFATHIMGRRESATSPRRRPFRPER